jgi:exosortase/archaeosortase family protein
MPKKKRKRRRRFRIDAKKAEMVLDFLIKFNILAIPMYIILFSGFSHYPTQRLLTDIVYTSLKGMGYWVERSGITILLFQPSDPPGPPHVESVVMGFDCTAWKTMYAFACLVIASPVAGRWKKIRFILVGGALLFAINIVRITSTIMVAYGAGFQYLDVVHTVLWREGLILALLALWFLWLRNQKNNISKSQTILRVVYARLSGAKPVKRPRKKRKRSRKR